MRTIAVALVIYWLATRAQPAPGTTLAWTVVPLRTPAPPPPELEPPATTRPSCPPMRTDAAPLPADTPLPHGVNHVTTSWTNAGWLAAWDEEHVQVSTDGGLTFAQMLDGPGQVRDVTFDCFGRAVVLRDGARIGVNDHGHEKWHTIPGMRTDEDSPAALIGGGPDVITVGVTSTESWRARMAITADLGRTWWFRDLEDYWEESRVTGHQNADGMIDIAITTADCMSDPTTWLRVLPDGNVQRDELGDVGVIRVYDNFHLSRYDHELLDGPLPRLLEDGAVYSLDKKQKKTRLREWPYDNAVVDRAGRLWAIDETKDGEDAWLVGGR